MKKRIGFGKHGTSSREARLDPRSSNNKSARASLSCRRHLIVDLKRHRSCVRSSHLRIREGLSKTQAAPTTSSVRPHTHNQRTPHWLTITPGPSDVAPDPGDGPHSTLSTQPTMSAVTALPHHLSNGSPAHSTPRVSRHRPSPSASPQQPSPRSSSPRGSRDMGPDVDGVLRQYGGDGRKALEALIAERATLVSSCPLLMTICSDRSNPKTPSFGS